MRTAIYARVSTDRQEVDNQLAVLRAFCQATGHEIAAEFVDEAITGSGRKKRPQFEQMMAAARQRQFDLLLFWSLDRLSREGALATLQHLAKLDGYGVAWRSHTKHYRYHYQNEVRIAWLPPTPTPQGRPLEHLFVTLGSLEDYCELIEL